MKAILSILLAVCCGLVIEVHAQAPAATNAPASNPTPPPSSPAKKSAAELEKLAVPIALHPDPLISIILPASVYPVEIVMAARFVKDTNNVSKVDSQPWDENVKEVAKFPELITKMNDDLEWTVALGQAFLEQRKELMDTIQDLRAKAQKAGTLKTTPQQIVTVTNSVVERIVEQQTVIVTNTIVQIQPSNPDVIYVPSYPPTVYYPPAYPYYYGYAYYPYAPLVTFGVGMMWGAAISHHWNHCDWHGGDVNINNDIDIDRGDRNRGDRAENRGDRAENRGDRAGDRAGDRSGNRAGDRAGNKGGGQSWQPNQNRLRSSGAPTAKTREARGYAGGSGSGSRFNSAATRPAGAGGGAASTRPAGAGGARPAGSPSARPAGSPGAAQRPSGGGAAQRPASGGGAVNRSPSASPRSNSSAFSGVGGGGSSARSSSNRGSYSRGGGGFSGGGGGRGGGGGGRGGGGGGRRR